MNPYGITQVDVPGILSVYEGQKQRRTEQMLMERKIAQEDRAFERQEKLLGIYSRIQRPTKGGDPASGGAAPASPSGVAAAYQQSPPEAQSVPTGSPLSPAPEAASPAAVGGPEVAPVAVPQSWTTANADLVSEMMSIAPEEAFKLSEHFSKLDEAAVKAAKERNDTIGSIAIHLMSFPPEGRSAELQRMAPNLAQIGIDASMLSGADLSDAGLQGYVAQAMDVDKILAKQDRDRTFEANQAHRAEQMKIARERLGVSQGALSLAQKRESRAAAGGGAGAGNEDLDYLFGDD